jgi:hypothetical protein
MDRTQGLTAAPVIPVDARGATCPECGTAAGKLPAVHVFLFGEALHRCLKCGARRTASGRALPPAHCRGCDLPFAGAGPEERCEDCRAGRFCIDASEMAAATEAEVRAALDAAWTFTAAPRTGAYLDRVAVEVARNIENAPLHARVLPFRDGVLRTLALPSGAILISDGMLRALEDEAELAFVLGHELVHAAAGDGARALAGLGLRGLADGAGDPSAWLRAASDLIRLGHGDDREHAADERAIRAVAAAGYDPWSALCYLQRTEACGSEGHEAYADMALSHPPAAARLRRLESPASAARTRFARVNREVYRRIAGHTVLATELRPVRPFDSTPAVAGRGRRLLRRGLWIALAGAAVLALLRLLV